MITEKIFKEIQPKLLRYAISLTKQKATGDDLVLEVVTKILEADSLPADLNIEAYAIRSIRNLFLNNEKKESREVREQDDQGESIYDQTEHPLSGGFVNDGDLERVLMGLEQKCRELLMLFAIGNSYREISDALEVPPGTVMSRMARCREHLSPIMGEN